MTRAVVTLCWIATLAVCPLVFFTDLTRNPYYTQITLLNLALLTLWLTWAIEGIFTGTLSVPRTSLDLPLWAFLGVATLSWGVSWLTHVPFFQSSIASEGSRVWVFSLVNALMAFYAPLVFVSSEARPARYGIVLAALAFAGILWFQFPDFRSQATGTLWKSLWDPYGALLWTMMILFSFFYIRQSGETRLLHLALAAGVLASGYGVLQYNGVEIIWPKVLNPYGGRAVSTFGNPNFLSSFLVLLFPVALAFYWQSSSWSQRWPYFVTLLVFSGSLLCSLTRSSWAGVAVACAVTVWGAWRRKELWARSRSAIVGLAAALVLMAVLWPRSPVGYNPTVIERARETLQTFRMSPEKTGTTYGPSHQRFLIWASAWKMLEERPILGKGWGCFELFYPFYQSAFLFDPRFTNHRTHANNAHNAVLEVASQMGLIGLGAALWWLVILIQSAGRILAHAPEDKRLLSWGLWGGALGMLADNLLNVSLFFAVPAFLFWWQLGFLFRMSPETHQVRHVCLKNPSARFLLAAFCLGATLLVFRAVNHWRGEVHYFQGFKLSKYNKLLEAVSALEKSYRAHKREVNNIYELGNTYARLQQTDKALWAYREALTANAGYDEIYFNMAVVDTNRGMIREALPLYRMALFINPLSLEAYRALGNVFMKDPAAYGEEPISYFQQAVRFHPGDKDLWNNLGVVYTKQQKDKEALEAYEQAWQIDPGFQEASHNMNLTLNRLGLRRHPFLEFQAAFKNLEDRVNAKDYAGALPLAQKIVSRWPNHLPSRLYLANLLVVAKRYSEAVAEYKKVLERQSRLTVARNNLAYVYRQLQQWDLARQEYEIVLRHDPSNATAKQGLIELQTQN